MTWFPIVVGLLTMSAAEPVTSQACMTVRAQRWWNIGVLRRATDDSNALELRNDHAHAVLFFRSRDGDLLRDLAKPLNRLNARRDWTVIGLSPDDPNAIAPLVYRNRLQFAVGAGSRAAPKFGAHKMPCLVVVRGASAKPEVHDNVEAALDALCGAASSSRPTAATVLPEDPSQLTPQTPVEILRACAFTSPSAQVRRKAIGLLKEQLDRSSFEELLAELMSEDPPPVFNTHPFKRAIWYAWYLASFTEEPDIWSFPGFNVPPERNWLDTAISEAYRLAVREKGPAELAKDYTDHLGDDTSDILIRQTVLARLDELPADQVLAFMPSLLAAERDVGMRQSLLMEMGSLWRRAGGDYTDLLVPLYEACLDPNEHTAVRVTAREMLQMIAEGRP